MRARIVKVYPGPDGAARYDICRANGEVLAGLTEAELDARRKKPTPPPEVPSLTERELRVRERELNLRERAARREDAESEARLAALSAEKEQVAALHAENLRTAVEQAKTAAAFTEQAAGFAAQAKAIGDAHAALAALVQQSASATATQLGGLTVGTDTLSRGLATLTAEVATLKQMAGAPRRVTVTRSDGSRIEGEITPKAGG